MLSRILLFCLLPTALFTNEDRCLDLNANDEPEKTLELCSGFLLSDTLETQARAIALEKRGIAHRELGNSEQSIVDLGASIALSQDTSVMRMLAWTYREAKRYEDAEALYSRVLESDKHEQGWLSRCVVRQDLGRYQDALSDCKQALSLDNDNLDTLFFTARVHSILEQPKYALPLAKRAMALAPNDPRHLVEYVWALHQMGWTNVAFDKATAGLKSFPNNPELILFLRETNK